MRYRYFIVLAALLLSVPLGWRSAGSRRSCPRRLRPRIDWEVKNRFRLFRDEKDFHRHVAATSGRSILAAEQTLEQETDGRGWARDMVARLCVDGAGRVLDTCVRDGARENLSGAGRPPRRGPARRHGAADASCAWTFDNGEARRADQRSAAARR